MRLTRSHDFAAAPDAVFAVLTDPAFQQAKCDATSLPGGVVDVQTEPSRTGVRTERHLPTDQLPDMVKGFVGAELVIVERVDWALPTAEGTRTANHQLQVPGTPISYAGTLTLSPTATGSRLDSAGDLKVNVPLIGGRIEKLAADPILAGFDAELSLADARVSG